MFHNVYFIVFYKVYLLVYRLNIGKCTVSVIQNLFEIIFKNKLNPYSRVSLQKLTGPQTINKFHLFYNAKLQFAMPRHLPQTWDTISTRPTKTINKFHLFCNPTLQFAVPRHLPQTWDTISTRPKILFFYHGAIAKLGQGFLIIENSWSHSDTPHSVGFIWTSDQPDAQTSTWQHTTLTCPGWIRTHHPSKRATADPCLRPRGHWDQFVFLRQTLILSSNLQQGIASDVPP